MDMVVELLSGERLRPLGLMRMIRTGVDLELAQLLGAEPGVRQHALDGAADDLLRPALEQVTERLLLEALRVATVARVDLAFELVARDGDATGIQDDDVIAGIEVGLEGGLVLALEDARDARGKPTQRLIRRVNDVPASLDLALAGRIGLRVHRSSSSPFGSPGGRPRATRLRQRPLAGAAAPSKAGPWPANAA